MASTVVPPAIRTIYPVIAVPSDGAGWNGDYLTALDSALDSALAWWHRQLGAPAFGALPPIAIGLEQPAHFYYDKPDTQERIRAELAAYYPELTGSGNLGIVYLVYACLSAGPYECPGNVIGTGAVAVPGPRCLIVQSSGSLDAFALGQNPLDPNSGSRDAQTGAMAHELGHALSLEHPTDSGIQQFSVMWSWWNFPQCSLSDAEQRQASRFAARWK